MAEPWGMGLEACILFISSSKVTLTSISFYKLSNSEVIYF